MYVYFVCVCLCVCVHVCAPLLRKGIWSSCTGPTGRLGQKYWISLGWSTSWPIVCRRRSEHRGQKQSTFSHNVIPVNRPINVVRSTVPSYWSGNLEDCDSGSNSDAERDRQWVWVWLFTNVLHPGEPAGCARELVAKARTGASDKIQQHKQVLEIRDREIQKKRMRKSERDKLPSA